MIDCNATVDSVEALKALSDEDVLAQAKQLMQLRRTVTASALLHVGEMEARGMPLDLDGWKWTHETPSVFLRAARVLRELPYLRELFQQRECSIASVAGLDVLLPPEVQAEIHGPEEDQPRHGDRSHPPLRRCQAGPDRYRLSFTVDRALYAQLKAASDLLSEQGDETPLEEVLVLALETLFGTGAKEPDVPT